MAEPYFGRLTESTRDEFRRASVRRSWPRGTTIFQEGDPADQVIVLEEGVVKALTTSLDGVETVLGLRVAGDVLGELAAIDGGSRSASVVTMEPSSGLALEVHHFRDLLAAHAEASFHLLDVIAGRLRDASRRQAEFGSLEATMRLARVLLDLAHDHGHQTDQGVEIVLVTQDELAGMCGVSRESVARGLAALRAEGLLTTGRRVITVVDLPGLTARVGS